MKSKSFPNVDADLHFRVSTVPLWLNVIRRMCGPTNERQPHKTTRRLYLVVFLCGCCILTGCPDPPLAPDAPSVFVEQGVARVSVELVSLGKVGENLAPSEIIIFGPYHKATKSITPMPGEYRYDHDETPSFLTFTPHQRISEDILYAAQELVSGQITEYDHSFWYPDADTTKILICPPDEMELPANHLKFYIHFSRPMRPTESWEHFSLKDLSTGELVPRPFRHIDLWDEQNRRLTLWFHPGRQKTGVNLNEDLGGILIAGHNYQLLIDPEWKTQTGRPLDLSVKKKYAFTVIDADHKQPNPNKWELTPPTADTIEPLIISFGEMLDFATAGKAITTCSSNETLIEFSQQADWDGTRVKIFPSKPWAAGDYTIAINPRLEDLAGNSLERPFEVDLSAEMTDFAQKLTLTFEIKQQVLRN